LYKVHLTGPSVHVTEKTDPYMHDVWINYKVLPKDREENSEGKKYLAFYVYNGQIFSYVTANTKITFRLKKVFDRASW
jgi:hypothetical protein